MRGQQPRPTHGSGPDGRLRLVVAGSHGFDIWSPETGTIEHDAATGFEELLASVTSELQDALASIDGAVVEPKRASVAAHYRLVAEPQRQKVERVVERLLAEHDGELEVTPGKMVYEIQPTLDWDKGRAVLHLLSTLGLDRDDVVPIYAGTTSPTSTRSRRSPAGGSA